FGLRRHPHAMREDRHLTGRELPTADRWGEVADGRVPCPVHLDLRRDERNHRESGHLSSLAVVEDGVDLEALDELVGGLGLSVLIRRLGNGQLADRAAPVACHFVDTDLGVLGVASTKTASVVTWDPLCPAMILYSRNHEK